jgi:hypothetical protein
MTRSMAPSVRALRHRSKVFSGVENSARGGGSWKLIDRIFSRGIFCVCPATSTV